MTSNLKIGDAWPFASVRGFTGAPLSAPVWYALITAPQREQKAADRLKGAGVDVRYPTVERVRHIRGKIRKYVYPMISQIIYARFRYQPNWDVMRDRRLITGVFSTGCVPLALSDDDVSLVMGLPTEAERMESERIEAMRPKVGEQAEITDGPLKGFFVDVTRVEFGRVWFETLKGLKGDAAENMIQRVVG